MILIPLVKEEDDKQTQSSPGHALSPLVLGISVCDQNDFWSHCEYEHRARARVLESSESACRLSPITTELAIILLYCVILLIHPSQHEMPDRTLDRCPSLRPSHYGWSNNYCYCAFEVYQFTNREVSVHLQLLFIIVSSQPVNLQAPWRLY